MGHLETSSSNEMVVYERLSLRLPDVSVYGQGGDPASKLIMYRRDAWLPSMMCPCMGKVGIMLPS